MGMWFPILGAFLLLILSFSRELYVCFMLSACVRIILESLESWLFSLCKIQSLCLLLLCLFFPLLRPSSWGVLDKWPILVPDFLLESPVFLHQIVCGILINSCVSILSQNPRNSSLVYRIWPKSYWWIYPSRFWAGCARVTKASTGRWATWCSSTIWFHLDIFSYLRV